MDASATPFTHIGLLYRSERRYLSALAGFLRGALAAGHPALVAVPPPRLDRLRAHMGHDADRITFADMSVAGRNPGRIIPNVLLAFAARHPGQRVAIIGEPIWPGRTDDEYPACALHEALINNAFSGRDAAILCPYDASGLDPTALADALRTHPLIADDGDLRQSKDYTIQAYEAFNRPLSPPPDDAAVIALDGATGLAGVREAVRREAMTAGLSSERTGDLVVAVNELATNTVEHGGGRGRVTTWAEHSVVVCQVEDQGFLIDPLAGRVPPERHAERGRGLVVVNLLCDLVRVHSEPGRTTTRLFMYR